MPRCTETRERRNGGLENADPIIGIRIYDHGEIEMKATILVDNYVPNKFELIGEPSFSCLVEADGLKILFDTGMSGIPFDNARKISLDLSDVTHVVLSHGHLDHTWGMENFIQRYPPNGKVKLICHPDALQSKIFGRKNIGMKRDESYLQRHFEIQKSKRPHWISDKIVFLGEIERKNDFEAKIPIGRARKDGILSDDYMLDDSALAIDGKDGIGIVTGCSHSGICNIAEYAKKVIGKEKIAFILGGFHMQSEDADSDIVVKTVRCLEGLGVERMLPCHCTNMLGKIAIGKAMKTGEVGTGSVIEFH